MTQTFSNISALRRIPLFRDARGVAAIEFALIFPIFILFLFMIIEYGLMFFGNAVITNMNNQVARESMVGCINAEIVNNACTIATYKVDEAQLRANIIRRSAGFVDANNASRFTFTVAAYTEFPNVMPATKINLGQGNDLRVFRMRYQWPVFFSMLKNIPPFRDMINFETYSIVRNEPFGTISDRRND